MFDLKTIFTPDEWKSLQLITVGGYTQVEAAEEMGMAVITFKRMIAGIKKKAAPYRTGIMSGEIQISSQ